MLLNYETDLHQELNEHIAFVTQQVELVVPLSSYPKLYSSIPMPILSVHYTASSCRK